MADKVSGKGAVTIAGIYLTPEGIVFGADSTSSAPTESGMHYLDFNQKIFQIGEASTLGVMTWGLGSLGGQSYRTLAAKLDDELRDRPARSVQEVATRWLDLVWPVYSGFELVVRFKALALKATHDPNDPASRTQDEEKEFTNLRSALVLGFCIGGYLLPDREPLAFSMVLDPSSPTRPTPNRHAAESWSWWGVPNIVRRLVFGHDQNLVQTILKSGKWSGTPQELTDALATQRLVHASLPIRDAVDYVHSCVYSTIKAMKFSSMAQVCGGPIEIAVITTDRKFRWVRHKPWDAAIIDGESDVRPVHHSTNAHRSH